MAAKDFRDARAAAVRSEIRLQENTLAEITRMLHDAQDEIRLILADAPSDYQLWSLPRLSADISRVLEDFSRDAGAQISSAARSSWNLGGDLVDAPLDAMGIRLAGTVAIDTQQLSAMRQFMTDRIKNIGDAAVNKINSELGLVVIGSQSPSDAIGAVTDILAETSRDRARTIVGTELGRVFSAAAQARLEDAAGKVNGLKKQWRRSGKLHPRPHHDLADGQLQTVDEPFVLRPFGKAPVRLMYPRDPTAPAGETINCGCMAIPWKDDWEVRNRGRAPGGIGEDAVPVSQILGE